MSDFLNKLTTTISKALNLDFIKYKGEILQIMETAKDLYSNLIEIFEKLNQKNTHFAFYALFQQYKDWINPSISFDYLSCNNTIFALKHLIYGKHLYPNLLTHHFRRS